jgi:hypothetical protein
MVTPINTSGLLNPASERSGESRKNTPSDTGLNREASQSPTTAPASENVEIGQGQQLLQQEKIQSSPEVRLTTPEQARNQLQQLLGQIEDSPEQALSAQANSRGEVLDTLLSQAPG